MDDLNNPQDRVINASASVIRLAVRALALLMTVVILFGVVDVAWELYRRLTQPPFLLLTISDMLATFGAFMAVLIAIEIFVNINLYLREDVIHVKIVMATALMAIARKVIILDFKEIDPQFVWATGAVVLAMSVGYWLVVKRPDVERGLFNVRRQRSSRTEPMRPSSGVRHASENGSDSEVTRVTTGKHE